MSVQAFQNPTLDSDLSAILQVDRDPSPGLPGPAHKRWIATGIALPVALVALFSAVQVSRTDRQRVDHPSQQTVVQEHSRITQVIPAMRPREPAPVPVPTISPPHPAESATLGPTRLIVASNMLRDRTRLRRPTPKAEVDRRGLRTDSLPSRPDQAIVPALAADGRADAIPDAPALASVERTSVPVPIRADLTAGGLQPSTPPANPSVRQRRRDNLSALHDLRRQW